MSKRKLQHIIQDEKITNLIFFLRGHKVMIDSDLAQMYGVETKRLKEAVKRNIERFPEQYMFELTAEEAESLRSQFATSKKGRGGRGYLPHAFTEHGVLMVANVLKSKRAIKMSMRIIDVFIKMREMLSTQRYFIEARTNGKSAKQKQQGNTIHFRSSETIIATTQPGT